MNSHTTSSVEHSRIIELERHRHPNGSLTVFENGAAGCPFDVRRVFYLYDVPADARRGGHSHHEACELIVALSGSFDVVLDDGKQPPRRYSLNRPYRALYIPAGLWRTLDNFSGGAVCMVLTSHRYSEADYVRDYDKFKQLANGIKI
ncbi:MAG: FdtA/QdtA family cupin domain-containing protein [Muribaculaceae bacterium]|nr:FdtA/QdtA family cupin domain-containing protein [Muribaculaceae bacterium]